MAGWVLCCQRQKKTAFLMPGDSLRSTGQAGGRAARAVDEGTEMTRWNEFRFISMNDNESTRMNGET